MVFFNLQLLKQKLQTKMNNPIVKIDAINLNNKLYTDNEEFLLAIGSEDDSCPVSVSFRQVVKNEIVADEFSLSSRLRGHKNAIEIKEEKNLTAWLYATKKHINMASWYIGKEFPTKTIKEVYTPFCNLKEKNLLDKNDMVISEPIKNPKTNEILLYPVDFHDSDGVLLKKVELPYIRTTVIEDGVYEPTLKPTYSSKLNPFEGLEKDENNKLTYEYKSYLTTLYKNSLLEGKDHLEVIDLPLKDLVEA